MKTYTIEELNGMLMDETLSKFYKDVQDFRDDIYNKGVGDGYKQGFEAALRKKDETPNL
jgi:hypothetical protein